MSASIDVVDPIEIFLLVVCFLGSAFFSGSEAVLMSLGIERAKQLKKEGKGAKGRTMAYLVKYPNELLATILVGNNIVNILAASLSTTIASRIFQDNAVGIATGVVTLVILIFGEIIPKSFARAHAEKLSVLVVYVLLVNYYILYPIVKCLVWIIHMVLGKKARLSTRKMTRDDFEYMINKAEKEKSMDSKQLDLLSSILEFPTIKVKDIMVPRLEVKYLKIKPTLQEIIDQIERKVCSRYPVCDGTLEETVGILHVKDLALVRGQLKKDFNIKNFLKDPFFVYEHMKIQAVFDYMNRKKIHLALVKDENDLVVGVVTLEDIIEEVMGEIHDEHDEEQIPSDRMADNLLDGVVLEGGTSLRELYNEYDIKIPLNDNYSTLSGFILDMLGNNFPKQGQMIFWEGLIFELLEVSEHTIKTVKIKDADGKKHLFSRREDTDNGHSSFAQE